ncbi:MAG: STAS domain-containing protein [Zavarzinella sp.]
MSEQSSLEYFSVTRRGEIVVIVPNADVEQLPSNVIETAAQVVLAPLKEAPPSLVVIDLSQVSYFGSEFISFLLRCHLVVKKHSGELVIAGVSDRIKELLSQTNLDTIWAIYPTVDEAIQMLGGAY